MSNADAGMRSHISGEGEQCSSSKQATRRSWRRQTAECKSKGRRRRSRGRGGEQYSSSRPFHFELRRCLQKLGRHGLDDHPARHERKENHSRLPPQAVVQQTRTSVCCVSLSLSVSLALSLILLVVAVILSIFLFRLCLFSLFLFHWLLFLFSLFLFSPSLLLIHSCLLQGLVEGKRQPISYFQTLPFAEWQTLTIAFNYDDDGTLGEVRINCLLFPSLCVFAFLVSLCFFLSLIDL